MDSEVEALGAKQKSRGRVSINGNAGYGSLRSALPAMHRTNAPATATR